MLLVGSRRGASNIPLQAGIPSSRILVHCCLFPFLRTRLGASGCVLCIGRLNSFQRTRDVVPPSQSELVLARRLSLAWKGSGSKYLVVGFEILVVVEWWWSDGCPFARIL